MPLQIRRGTELERTLMTVPLAEGELLYVTDDQRLYIGNGATRGGVQITGYTDEDAQDAAASMLTNGLHSGITFTYSTIQDAAGRIDAAVDLSTYSGAITGDLTGSVYATDTTLLVDGTSVSINLDGTIKGNVIPSTDSAYDLGSSSFKFRDLYLSGASIHLGNALITSSGTAVDLPLGSTMGGIPLGSGGSDVSGNIIGDDSTVIVNTHTKSVTAVGGFIGDLVGNVNGSVLDDTGSTTLVDGANSLITGNVENSTTTSLEFFAGSPTTDGIIRAYNTTANFTEFNTITGSGSEAWIDIQSSRGTLASPTATQNTDPLSGLLLFGHNGTSFKRSVVIGALQDGAITADEVPGKFVVLTKNAAGSGDNYLTFDSNGLLTTPRISVADGDATNPSISFSTDGSVDTGFFHPGDGIVCISTNGTEKVRVDTGGIRVVGFAKVGGFATGSLPAPAEAGMIVLDTTTNQFKGYNGSAWVVLG